MTWLARFAARRRLHRELAEEIQTHLDEKADELMAGGLSRDEALSAARRLFGNVTLIEERSREVWAWPLLETCWTDARNAARRLRRSPTSAVVAILSVGLGIGAATSIFSVVHAVLISPYPYRDVDRMVHLHVLDAGTGSSFDLPLSTDQYREFRRSPILDDSMAMDTEGMSAAGPDLPELVNAAHLSPNAFRFLGVPPLHGRVFTPVEATNPAEPEPVAVLSHQYWQRRYGGDANAVGQMLRLDNQSYRIIGVMPRRFAWWSGDVYLPLRQSSDPDRLATVFARLRPGIADTVAQQQIQVLVQTLSAQRPNRFPAGFHVALVHMNEIATGAWSGTLLALFGAVSLLLAIGCANVSILLVAQGTGIASELAIRRAIGASRGRIVRQLLTESLVISMTGGLIGMVIAWAAVRAAPGLVPERTFPAESVIRLSAPVLLFIVAAAVLTGLLFGLWPALHLSRSNFQEITRVDGRVFARRHGPERSHDLLLTGQVALTVVLLAGSGATIRAFFNGLPDTLDYDPRDVTSIRIDLRDGTYAGWSQRADYFDRIQRAVAAIPGVASVAISLSDLPPSRPFHGSTVELAAPRFQNQTAVLLHEVSGEYFTTLRVPLRRGRWWTRSETRQAARVAVINESMARRYWPDGNPTQQWIYLRELRASTTWALDSPGNDGWVQIVGVAADTPNTGLQRPPSPAVYVPYTLVMGDSIRLIVRSARGAATLARSVAVMVHRIDRDQPVGPAQTAEAMLDSELWLDRGVVALLFGIFAALALLLAAAGLYSVGSYLVSQRRHEFGLRMALGAQRKQIVWLVLTYATTTIGTGLALGLALSAALNDALARRARASVRDPYVFASLALLLFAVGTLAALIPAYRAGSIDPISALRAE